MNWGHSGASSVWRGGGTQNQKEGRNYFKTEISFGYSMYGSYIFTSYEGKSDYAREQLLETANAQLIIMFLASWKLTFDRLRTSNQKMKIQLPNKRYSFRRWFLGDQGLVRSKCITVWSLTWPQPSSWKHFTGRADAVVTQCNVM